MERPKGGPIRHRVTVRASAPPSPKEGAGSREEFQILGDGQWDERLYPAGNDTAETVVLKSGGPPSPVSYSGSHGHGRNWAVEGKPGSAFDITFDPDKMTIKCNFHRINIFHRGRLRSEI
eukprot:gnl/MRDRNA2_/MRDRNA2_231439_c0_seq1.p1 gnl/MRDRNA2_/MRDRNA2_231439_c0~~gnl/MRDRNA2_/MRDRNA2_231439_c0_seq1.p1  ORF type:complete len:127 (+),score=21.20 gnl/MRDRNA2_/MRDRNA2_231439_c0_seq1:22-381(+)